LAGLIRTKSFSFNAEPFNLLDPEIEKGFLLRMGGCAFGGHLFAFRGAGEFGDGFRGDDFPGVFRVAGGDLERVEEDTRVLAIDAVFGKGDADLADGVLDGPAVFKARKGERKGAGLLISGALSLARVEVAVGLAAQSGRAALSA
jgi:hypothetical protein